MKKLIFYGLLGCFMPFPAWAGDLGIPLIIPYVILPYSIIPSIIVETGLLFWLLHKDGISKTKAFVATLWARGYSMLMGIPSLLVILCVLQFIIVGPIVLYLCSTFGECTNRNLLEHDVLAFGIHLNSGHEYFTILYQTISYYFLLVLLEYGIFQRELPGIDKKRLLKISFIINSITYLIWLIIICIWVAIS